MSAKYTFLAWEVDINKAPLKLTLLQLANNANDDGVSWYSVPKMARRCGMSERALQGHIKNPGRICATTPAESAPHPRRICGRS